MDRETDFVVVGTGVAGLRAALELAHAGARVVALTKERARESNTEYAQGGVAVALADDDEARLHEDDTLAAGAGLCDAEAVRVLVGQGQLYMRELIARAAREPLVEFVPHAGAQDLIVEAGACRGVRYLDPVTRGPREVRG